jgi:hypothetical protein
MKKVYIRHRDDYGLQVGPAEGLAEDITAIAKDMIIEMEINFTEESGSRIPRDYDIYFLHLSDTNAQDFIALREEQSWSYIVGLTGNSKSNKIKDSNVPLTIGDLWKYCDEIYYVPSFHELERTFERIVARDIKTS